MVMNLAAAPAEIFDIGRVPLMRSSMHFPKFQHQEHSLQETMIPNSAQCALGDITSISLGNRWSQQRPHIAGASSSHRASCKGRPHSYGIWEYRVPLGTSPRHCKKVEDQLMPSGEAMSVY